MQSVVIPASSKCSAVKVGVLLLLKISPAYSLDKSFSTDFSPMVKQHSSMRNLLAFGIEIELFQLKRIPPCLSL